MKAVASFPFQLGPLSLLVVYHNLEAHKMFLKIFLAFALSLGVTSISAVSIDSSNGNCVEELRISVTKPEDIPYWDVDEDQSLTAKEKQTLKHNIVSDFQTPNRLVGENAQTCFCPRIFGPVVCDQFGTAHPNVCSFLCEKRRIGCSKKGESLQPVKVLALVDPGKAQERCSEGVKIKN